MAELFLQVLGPLRVTSGGVEVDPGPQQQRSLLALLLARAGQPISVSALVELIWGADPPPSAVNIIHKYVGALRRRLEPGLALRAPGAYLVRHGSGYRFAAGAATLDVLRFRQLVAEATLRVDGGELEAALDRYNQALLLVEGPAGDGLARTPMAQATFASLDGEFLDAVVRTADIAAHLRRPSQVLAPVRFAAAMDPLNELVQACLVTTLAASGRQAEALATYQTTRARLVDELGIEPGRALQEAHRQVLTQGAPRRGTDPSGSSVLRSVTRCGPSCKRRSCTCPSRAVHRGSVGR